MNPLFCINLVWNGSHPGSNNQHYSYTTGYLDDPSPAAILSFCKGIMPLDLAPHQ